MSSSRSAIRRTECSGSPKIREASASVIWFEELAGGINDAIFLGAGQGSPLADSALIWSPIFFYVWEVQRNLS